MFISCAFFVLLVKMFGIHVVYHPSDYTLSPDGVREGAAERDGLGRRGQLIGSLNDMRFYAGSDGVESYQEVLKAGWQRRVFDKSNKGKYADKL
jgi:hypothetical protein